MSLWRENTRTRPTPTWVDFCPSHGGCSMLPYLRLFRNCFSSSPHSQWDQRGTDGRHRMGRAHLAVLVGSARCQTGHRLVAAGIPVLALALAPSMPMRKPVVALPGETVCVHDEGGYINTCFPGPILTVESPRCRPDDHSLTRHHQPYLLATAAGVAQSPRLLRRSRTGAQESGHIGGVPTGDRPLYLRATAPCTYGRPPLVPTGDRPLYLRATKDSLTHSL
jgi:hypothetical protein